jgi:tRNA-specific 2-thiouridylase
MARVVLAMSGGVDSSVAAHLLIEQGHEVIGVFMRHGERSPITQCKTTGTDDLGLTRPQLGSVHKQGCCSASDADDARRVADRMGIPFYALNMEREFSRIIDYFVEQYTSGRTPNPCVMCNHWLKFGKLFDYADSVGASYVATGHYARLQKDPKSDTPQLCRGRDAAKDQSYVLFGIDRSLLNRMLLPVGEFGKAEIRGIAAQIRLRVADKRDSQEICFVEPGKHAQFVRRRREPSIDTSGEIVTTGGRVVGRHEGIESFTIGQRKGLGVAMGEPYFVIRVEPDSRRVVIGKHEELARRRLTAQQSNWLVDLPQRPIRCQAQIRYNATAADAIVEILAGDRLAVTFDEPRYGVAPGQAVVCYDGSRVLGGGWIE